MRKAITLFFFLDLFNLVQAQDHSYMPRVSVKWAPASLILGNISMQAEYNFGKNSLTAKIGIPASATYTTSFSDQNASFSMRATSFLAGYRTYLSKKHMKGLYFEPYFKYVHHASEGSGNATLNGQPVVMNFTNNYNGIGLGAEFGVQFIIWKRFVIDLFFLGPEINSSTNNFKAVDGSSVLPWTTMQQNQAKQDVTDFINKFPFIKNKTAVMVDSNNKTVTADFNGALPGFRVGVSFGIAF